jgi:hypothetical protein
MSTVTPLAILVVLSDGPEPTFVVPSDAMFVGLKTSVMGILQETAGDGGLSHNVTGMSSFDPDGVGDV